MYRFTESPTVPLYKAQNSYIIIYNGQIFEKKCIPKIWFRERPGVEDVLKFFCLDSGTPSILNENFVWAADIVELARKVLEESVKPASEEGHYDADKYVADILSKLGFEEVGEAFENMDKWFC